MLGNARSALERTTTIPKIEDRARALDTTISHIKDIIDDEELSGEERKRFENLMYSHLRQFLVFLNEYGNSGFSEAIPLVDLFMNNIKVFAKISEEDPSLADVFSRFFSCLCTEEP